MNDCARMVMNFDIKFLNLTGEMSLFLLFNSEYIAVAGRERTHTAYFRETNCVHARVCRCVCVSVCEDVSTILWLPALACDILTCCLYHFAQWGCI